jgi:hypothetical protein
MPWSALQKRLWARASVSERVETIEQISDDAVNDLAHLALPPDASRDSSEGPLRRLLVPLLLSDSTVERRQGRLLGRTVEPGFNFLALALKAWKLGRGVRLSHGRVFPSKPAQET